MQGYIYGLISLGREGSYWDYKLQKGDNIDLVHDIICLANNPHHNGARFIIFGVEDDGEIIGVKPNEELKLNDIITLLRSNNFAGGICPEIDLRKYTFKNKNGEDAIVQTIIIKDNPNLKPYYLEKPMIAGGQNKRLHSGAIYTRVGDSNTPKDGTASIADFDKISRQRLGLDMPPRERLERYLMNFEQWTQLDEGDNWYYQDFPEFTIKRSEEPKNEVNCNESWVRCALAPKSYVYDVQFKYHGTILHYGAVLSYDDWQAYFPTPDHLPPLGKFDDATFYYYLMDDFKFIYLQFLRQKPIFIKSEITGGRVNPPIVIFRHMKERDEFIEYLKNNVSLEDVQKEEVSNEVLNFYERDVANIKLSKYVKRILSRWREHRQ